MCQITDIESMNRAKASFASFRDKPFREYQSEAIDFILSSNKPVVALSAPTGSGKSLIGMCSGAIKKNMVYLCHSKSLQNQIIEDFGEAEKLWGRNNYPCTAHPMLTAAECTHSSHRPCEYIDECEYRTAKRRVLNAPLRILNYSYYLYECNYVGRFSGLPLIICDEADMIESLLSGFIGLNITSGQLKMFKLDLPKYKNPTAKNGLAEWKMWAEKAQDSVRRKLVTVKHILEDSQEDEFGEEHIKALRQKHRIESLLRQLSLFLLYVDETWIMEEHVSKVYGTRWTFSPLWLTEKLAYQYFWRHADRFVLMSATLPPVPVLSKLLGIPIGDIDYKEIDSTFPVDRRPIHMRPVANITAKTFNDEIPKVVIAIRDILHDHPNEKGLIHAVSYKLAREIVRNIDGANKDRIITHNARNKIDVLEKFKSSNKPLVLISPSCERGIDLPDDYARFIIWAKMPYLSRGDQRTEKRLWSGKLGSYWYKSSAVMSLVQGTGRAMRSKDDWCVTYILDQQAVETLGRYPSIAPKWWRDAVW